MKCLEISNELFLQLYIGCQVRQGDMQNFFAHENHLYPPSLSDMGQLRQGTKSDLLDCLEQGAPSCHERTNVDESVIDGAVVFIG